MNVAQLRVQRKGITKGMNVENRVKRGSTVSGSRVKRRGIIKGMHGDEMRVEKWKTEGK
jgi:hypothetical protein